MRASQAFPRVGLNAADGGAVHPQLWTVFGISAVSGEQACGTRSRSLRLLAALPTVCRSLWKHPTTTKSAGNRGIARAEPGAVVPPAPGFFVTG